MSYVIRTAAISIFALAAVACGNSSSDKPEEENKAEALPVESETAVIEETPVKETPVKETPPVESTETEIAPSEADSKPVEEKKAKAAVKNDNRFSATDVENFLRVTPELDAIEDRYPDINLGFDANSPGTIHELIDEKGNLNVFSHAIGTMENRDAHKEIVQAVKKNGFKNEKTFATKADAIMMAFISINIDEEELTAMKEMTPERLAAMPATARSQVEAALRMLKAAQKVPADQKATVRPFAKQIEAAF